MPYRVLPIGGAFGRTLVVDPNGNGDYTTVQAAINAAQAQTPSASARWLVLVAPGTYAESLTLYDYVDLAALSPGITVRLEQTSQSVIANGALCWISGFQFDGQVSPVLDLNSVPAGSGAAGRMVLDSCLVDQSYSAVDGVEVDPETGGVVELRRCTLKVHRTALVLKSNTVELYDCRLYRGSHAQVDDQAVVQVEAGALLAYRCNIENLYAGYAVYFSAANSASKLVHCVLRYGANGAVNYVADAASASTALFLANAANAAAHPTHLTNVTELHIDTDL
jgi:hypothetical protein